MDMTMWSLQRKIIHFHYKSFAGKTTKNIVQIKSPIIVKTNTIEKQAFARLIIVITYVA